MTYDEYEQMLKVMVIDDGRGIKAEDIGKLFCMFGKLRRTAEINNEGIGMGLMICQSLVKMNHGTISAHSKGLNKGSIFSFTMHMKQALESEENSVRDSQEFLVFDESYV